MHDAKDVIRKFMNRGQLFKAIGVSYDTGKRYLKRGILKPDARGSAGIPLFDADELEKHKQSILDYRLRIKAARENALN